MVTQQATKPEAAVEEAPRVSVVMPCLNEAEGVAGCVKQALDWFAANGIDGEVVVCDNGSTDGSQDLARAAGARVVTESRPGYGRASWTAIKAARGRYIVSGDADGTYDFGGIGPMIERLEAGDDMVIGNRLTGDLQKDAMPWLHRHVGTPVISLLLRRFTGTKMGDSQCGLRAMTREARDSLDLVSGGMEFASEMILKAERRGLRMSEVPISYSVRVGESKLRTFSDGWRHLKLLLLLTPETTFLAIAVALFAMGLAFQVAAAATSDSQPVLVGTVLMVVGLNTFMIGAIARVHASRKGFLKPDWLTRLLTRASGLEILGSVAAGLFLTGIVIYGLFLLNVFHASDDNFVWQHSVAQAFVLLGVNLAAVMLVIGLYESEPPAE
jgi:Glycosyl transferase family 2